MNQIKAYIKYHSGQKFNADPLTVFAFISFLFLSISVMANQSSEEINIYWTDTGVYMWNRPDYLIHPEKYTFGPFVFDVKNVFRDISPKGQILVPMPNNKDLPKTEEDWQLLTKQLYQGIRERITKGLKDNVLDYEIRTVQNITIKGGYTSSDQQNLCIRFTKAFLEALAQVKNDISPRCNVAGVVGSNGGNTATKAIPYIKNNPIDKLVIIDGRAYREETIETYKSLNGNLIIINTAGDAPAFYNMIANHEVAKDLKKQLTNLTVIWTDTEGGFSHIKNMNPEAVLWTKEFTGKGYTKKSKLTAWELLYNILNRDSKEILQSIYVPAYQVNHDLNNPGKSMNEAQTLTETIHDKKRA